MLIKIEKNVQKNTLKSWKYNFVICAPHSVSTSTLPFTPHPRGGDNCESCICHFWNEPRPASLRPTAVRIPRFECKWYMWAGRRGARGRGNTYRATRLVCHLRRHQAQSHWTWTGQQAQDRSGLRVVQMTYKNLIFNNTNQFKNHQRHKNSFAGAYQEGGRGGGGQTKSHFISHFGITARKVTKMKLLR